MLTAEIMVKSLWRKGFKDFKLAKNLHRPLQPFPLLQPHRIRS